MLTLQTLTRAREIGANSLIVRVPEGNYMLDSGMHPKTEGYDALPDYSQLRERELDAIIISHAHHDHIGSLPVTMREQPRADVYMSEPTARLSEAMLHNSVNVMMKQREEFGLTYYPFFTHRELDDCVERWLCRHLRQAFELPGGAKATFYDAGHILGSTGIFLKSSAGTILFTGDMHLEDQTICMAADFPTSGVDVLVMETTRGARARDQGYSRANEVEHLARVITEVHARGGSSLMPVFALGKSQELLVMLHHLKEEGKIPDLPIYIGGLSTKITGIYDDFASRVRRNYPGFEILEEVELVLSSRRKKEIKYEPRALYALSSGMMTEHTPSFGLARLFLENPRNALLFVGYSDPLSPAGLIRSAETGQKLSLIEKGPQLPVLCQREEFDFSSHAPRHLLLEYAKKLKPKHIVLVHGDPEAQDWFIAALRAELPETTVQSAIPGQVMQFS